MRRLLLLAIVATVACSAGKDAGSSTPPLGDGGTSDVTVGADAGSSDSTFELDAPLLDTDTADTAAVGDGPVGVQDAKPEVVTMCTESGVAPAAGPYPHTCATATTNECDGKSDTSASLPNGANGNGYDDDCDGIVDEGCTCDSGHPPGTTKDCWLVPGSQAPATQQAGTWCAANTKGTMTCIQTGTGEFIGRTWDGVCRGAQPPFADDACAPGDFDCDGAGANPRLEDCACKDVQVTCPTDPLVTSPYPVVTDLEKKKVNPLDPSPATPFVIDGSKWVTGATPVKWSWTVTGGDCDNILPHPTFAIYNGKDASKATRLGTESKTLGPSAKQKGLVTPANDGQKQIWPAFSLSGDYVVTGSFEVQGKQYSCSQRVQVRWPGLRAEMCWDMEATAQSVPFFGKLSTTDVDLHLARLQGNASCAGKHGWFDSCGTAPNADDCYFGCGSGCVAGSFGCPGAGPGWGYAQSAADACHGWGSLRLPAQPCDNPRLDRDNITCNPSLTDPNAPRSQVATPQSEFCGPENINVDAPKANDQFLVGVHFYSGSKAHPHVNIYCNGERKLALGFDPTSTPQITKPELLTSYGSDTAPIKGDLWEVARVSWSGGTDPCKIEPVPSAAPKADKDGNTNICVDTNPQNKATPVSTDKWLFTAGDPTPTTPIGSFCWH